MTTTISSPLNTATESVDSVVLSTGTAGLLKRAVPGSSRSVTSGDTNAAAQETGTHADDAAFGIAVDTVSAAGFLADATSPDSVDEGDIGVARMTLARKQIVVSSADTATLTQVASSASSGTILAANVNRIGAMIFNTDANNLYLAFTASAATTSAFTIKIAAGGYYEFPQPVYRGTVTGIWDVNGSGSAVCTELT